MKVGVSGVSLASRVREAAPSRSAPVTPLPIAASVKAISIAHRRTQTSARSNPYTTNPTTAANVSRTVIVQTVTASTSMAKPISTPKETVMLAFLPAAPRAQ